MTLRKKNEEADSYLRMVSKDTIWFSGDDLGYQMVDTLKGTP